jgi:murein L,D-transpeptidase YcbB/YkuD
MAHDRKARRLSFSGLSLVALAWLVAAQPAHGQELEELIRARIEQLLDTGMLEVAGVSIAARTLLPRIYEARSFAPAWRDTVQIDSLVELIDEAYREGLDPQDYHDEAVRAARERFPDLAAMPADERAALDLMLTDSVVRLGYHLRFGKVDPLALDSDWNLSRELVDQDPVMTLQAAIDAPSMREFAAQVLPRNPLYRRLKVALADYRAIAANGGWPEVPGGRTGFRRRARVPTLEQRLRIPAISLAPRPHRSPRRQRRRRKRWRERRQSPSMQARSSRQSGASRSATGWRPTACSDARLSRRSTCRSSSA